MAIQASYEGIITQDIDSSTGAKTFGVSPALTNADGVLKVSTGTDREEWFEITGTTPSNSTITTGVRGVSLTSTAVLVEDADNKFQHFAGEKIAVVTFPNTIYQPEEGAVAPSSTPDRVGDMYVDSTANKVYVATGTTNSSDWTVLN